MSATRKPADALAMSMMVVVCACWGLQQVTIKFASEGISPLLQAGLRSVIATALLLAWSAARGTKLFERDGTLASGLAAGALFAGEFVFIYVGLAHTTASRMVVFIYLAPCLTALGLQWFVPGEQLSARQWMGVLLAFAGVALAFADGFGAAAGSTLLGDLFGAIAAVLWAATTVLVRATRLGAAFAAAALLVGLGIVLVNLR